MGNWPANGVSYSNLDHTDSGVNIAPNGDLSGFAWSGVGWMNFDTSSAAPDHARFDSGVGRFRGFAWGETAWINLDHETHFVAKASAEVPCECDADLVGVGPAGLTCTPSGSLTIPDFSSILDCFATQA